MSDRFYGSRYGKHSTYYGMNNSSLYGSNFSSVFADAPPPLEDFHEEDDDMVFRNSGKSSPENGETTALKVKSETKTVSPDTEFKWVSKGNTNSNGNNDEEFGDFSGFADFKSAFSTSSCNSTEKEECFGEPNNELTPSGTDGNRSWLGAPRAESGEANDIDSKKAKEQSTCSNDYSVNVVDDDDFADFEGFDGAENQKNNFAFGSVSRDSEIENSCPSSPLPPIMDMPNNGLPPKFNKKSTEDDETQLSKNRDNLGDKDLASSGAQLSDEKSLVQSESESFLSHMPGNGFVGSEYKNSKSNQRDLINKRGDDEDDFGSFMSTRSLSPENDSDAFTMENSDHQVDCSKESVSTSLEEMSKTDESNKSLPEDDDFGEFSAVGTQYPSVAVDFPASGDSACSGKFRPFESKEKQSINDKGDDLQFLSNENDLVSSRTSVKGDLELPNVQSHSHPNDPKTSLNLAKTEEPEKMEKHYFKANENGMDINEEQIDETDEFRDFATVGKSLDCLGAGIDKQADGGPRDEEIEGTNEQKTSIDSSNKVTVGENKENMKNTPEKVCGNDFGEMNSHSEESFGDFRVITIDQKSKKQHGKTKNTDNDFGEFGTAEIDDFGDFKATANDQESGKCAKNIKRQDSDFGEFGTSDENNKDNKNSSENDEFGDFSTSDDNSFGNFGAFKYEETIANTNTSIINDKLSKTNDADDFGSFSDVESKSGNFADSTTASETGDWANFSASKQNSVSDHDNFGSFSSSGTGTAANVEFAAFNSSSVSSTFGSFGSSGVKEKTHKEKREQTDSRSGTCHSHIKKTEPESAASGTTWSAVPHKSGHESVFKPGGKVVMLQAGKPLVAAFSSLGHLSGRGMQINSLGIRLSSSSVSEMWKEIQLSERNGSLRFQWLSCHSQYKQLLSLDVVPDSLPVTSLLTPGGEGHKNMLPFMVGPGFVVEPSSGPVTSFRSGVKDVDPSQDPFGAPPEVGLPDLSFGFSNSKYPDFKQANRNSGSVALDLDFLATPRTPELASKQEHKSIYDEDLLGLDMQFSLDPQGQFKLPSAPNTPSPKSLRGKDSRKVFKFGNVTIPLAPQDSEQELSNKAKEVVSEIEDLSFMLSSVLMFPLKSR